MKRPATVGAFAVLTPPGRGGIAVVRCLGPGAPEAIAACFRPPRAVQSPQMSPSPTGANLREPPPPAPDLPAVGRLAYGHFVDAGGRPLDEIILYREAETVFEVNCHGGPAAVEAVCRRLADLGLERVDPDRLLALEGAGPIERDAERMLRAARTPLAGRILLDQRNGALARALERILKDLAAGRSAEAGKEIDVLLGRWQSCGRLLASPPRVAVAGPPNVGKSTLVNRLVGTERVLVSATPGTTRDYVEADAALEGLPVVLVDTAGLRESGEAIEREGVARARRQVAGAAVVVYLLDAAEGVRPEDVAALGALGDRAVAAWNKADLLEKGDGSRFHKNRIFEAPRPFTVETTPVPFFSALRGDGMDALGRAILARLGWRPTAPGDAVPFTPAQADALEAAGAALARGDTAKARRCLQPVA